VEVFFANFKKTLPWWKSFLFTTKNMSVVEIFFANFKKTLPWWKSFLLISKKHFPGGSVF